MITKWKLPLPSLLSKRKSLERIIVCVCMLYFLSNCLGFSLPFQWKLGNCVWRRHVWSHLLIILLFKVLKNLFFLNVFFILHVQYSIYLFHIQYCYNIMLYEEIVFLNKYCKNKLRILYHILYQKKSRNTFSRKYSSKFIFFFSRFLENARFSSTQWIWRNTASWEFSKRISAA